MRTNTLLLGDTLYHLDAPYRAGALAMRQGIPWNVANPYRYGTQKHDQFDYGHVNESSCEHIRFGVDVIEAAQVGQCFQNDPGVPRDEYGVEFNWYRAQLCAISSLGKISASCPA